jgi:hypothetical protein
MMREEKRGKGRASERYRTPLFRWYHFREFRLGCNALQDHRQTKSRAEDACRYPDRLHNAL